MRADAQLPRFPLHALLSCEGCGEVFVNWSRYGTTCRRCGAARLHEVRWPAAGRHG